MADVLLVYVTVPSDDDAATMARTVVRERLAACANLVPSVKSFYEWNGKMEEAGETILILKTTAEMFPSLKKRLVDLHTAEIPCIVALPITAGHEGFLAWIASQTQGNAA